MVASFPAGGFEARVVPSAEPARLDAIVTSTKAPFAAINGGFYDRSGAAMGLVRAQGRDVIPLRKGGGSGVFVYADGAARIDHRDAYPSGAPGQAALQSIDRIVSGGVSLVKLGGSSRRAARSAVALDAEGGVHLVVAFDDAAPLREEDGHIMLGPRSASTGPTLGQMAILLTRSPEAGGVRASEALGLDGAVSTALMLDDGVRTLHVQPFNATINALVLSPAP